MDAMLEYVFSKLDAVVVFIIGIVSFGYLKQKNEDTLATIAKCKIDVLAEFKEESQRVIDALETAVPQVECDSERRICAIRDEYTQKTLAEHGELLKNIYKRLNKETV